MEHVICLLKSRNFRKKKKKIVWIADSQSSDNKIKNNTVLDLSHELFLNHIFWGRFEILWLILFWN